MKIDAFRPVTTVPIESVREPKKTQAPATAGGHDTIVISRTAQMLNAALAMDEPFDEGRVAELQAKLSSGQYVVDNKALAAKLAAEIISVARLNG